MKRKILTFLFSSLLLFNIGCNNGSGNRNSSENEEEYSENKDNNSEDGSYKDGTYCAEVEYYNPSTGTRNTYDLDVEVESGELTVIHWLNSGWLDNSHFYPEDITDGECEFTSDKGYRYTITLGELGGCGYTDENKIRRDVNNEVEATTCPKCGDEKYSYDDYCDDCQDKIEHTCKRCGQVDNFMFSTDDYCSDCEDKLENTCSRCGGHEYNVNGGICSSCKNDDDENDE
jgi:ribosomal protein L37E